MKLRDDKTCYRHDHSPEVDVRTMCRFGYCVIMRCHQCGLETGAEWGPVACPCKKNENGTLRWFKYPDMDARRHVPVKKSTVQKRSHGGRRPGKKQV